MRGGTQIRGFTVYSPQPLVHVTDKTRVCTNLPPNWTEKEIGETTPSLFRSIENVFGGIGKIKHILSCHGWKIASSKVKIHYIGLGISVRTPKNTGFQRSRTGADRIAI